MNNRRIPPSYLKGNIPENTQEDIPRETQVVPYHVMSPQMYEALEAQCSAPNVNHQTTDQQVAFLLGIQHVLQIIRRGFATQG